MNWDAIGAIGEILGALAVVGTLFYLARQMRQNAEAVQRSNAIAQASSIQDSNADHIQIFSQLSHDGELAAIYHRALAGEELSAPDTVRFAAFVNAFFAYMESALNQLTRGLLHEEFAEMEAHEAFVVGYPFWGRFLRTKAGKDWWNNDAPHQYSAEFLDLINKIRGEKDDGLDKTSG